MRKDANTAAVRLVRNIVGAVKSYPKYGENSRTIRREVILTRAGYGATVPPLQRERDMMETIAAPLPSWESFYVIIGSSAAALTGLMFVVITLMADHRARTSSPTIAAFGTPTVVHFCIALLISAILSAPWHELSAAGIALGISGAGGLSTPH